MSLSVRLIEIPMLSNRYSICFDLQKVRTVDEPRAAGRPSFSGWPTPSPFLCHLGLPEDDFNCTLDFVVSAAKQFKYGLNCRETKRQAQAFTTCQEEGSSSRLRCLFTRINVSFV